MIRIPLSVMLVLIGLWGSPTPAAEHLINMVGIDGGGQFEPAFLKVEPGDIVRFVAVDPGHDSDSILNGIPEGAEGWRGKINEELTVTLPLQGLYAFKCTPHFVHGMVGLIQVGDTVANAEAIAALKLPDHASRRMQELLAMVIVK